MQVILDFCVNCGVLLPEGKGNEEKPQCDSCGTDVDKREFRIQGFFEEDQARLLREANSAELV